MTSKHARQIGHTFQIPSETRAMPYEFTLVGEHITHEYLLLVLGTDGNYYEYRPGREEFSRVDPDDSWEIFVDVDEEIVERLREERTSKRSLRRVR
jgi:hypothetical protein